MEVGVRQLRDALSRHLVSVQEGRTLTVTDHGRPIARIIPVSPTRLEVLQAEGRVQPARAPKGKAPRPVAANGTVSDLLDDQRR